MNTKLILTLSFIIQAGHILADFAEINETIFNQNELDVLSGDLSRFKRNTDYCDESGDCECPEDFGGPQCKHERVSCDDLPMTPTNADSDCFSDKCIIKCEEGYKFADGSPTVDVFCKDKYWVTAKADWFTVPDCVPICSPPCQNDGTCISVNACKCTNRFKGPQCQHSASVCSVSKLKLQNGRFNKCKNHGGKYSCQLVCNDGYEFTSPPADEYTCEFSVGKFMPETVPQCIMTCTGGKIYMPCGPEENSHCPSDSDDNEVDNDDCLEGCFCPPGSFEHDDKCIPKEECPCKVRNKEFPPGSVVPKDCNTCTCESGEWKCTEKSCAGNCDGVGDPHYTTFDGMRYDFMGTCSYYFVRTDNFDVTVENVPCNKPIPDGPSCTKSVKILTQGVEIHLKQGKEVAINGKPVPNLPVKVSNIVCKAASSVYNVVELPDGVQVWWDGVNHIYVDVPSSFKGKTKGLCGTFNLNHTDDLNTPGGMSPEDIYSFANSWKTEDSCLDIGNKNLTHPCDVFPENKKTAEELCGHLKSKMFEECHLFVDVERYYHECTYDMCSCEMDVATCLCPTIAGYAKTCAKNRIIVPWRSHIKQCEIKCSEGQVYQQCSDTCARTCWDVSHRDEVDEAGNTCQASCVEGCNCPVGQAFDKDEKCVPIAQCPCYLNGTQFEPGFKEVRPGKKGKELCECKNGVWECTDRSNSGVCAAWGNSHFTTFDGIKFDFEGICTYLMTSGIIPDTEEQFSVEIENGACGQTGATCLNTVKLTVGSGDNAESISFLKNKPLPDVAKIKKIKLRKAGMFMFADVPSLGLVVQWDEATRAYIKINPKWKGKLKGLCGNYNDDTKDDFLTPSGNSVKDATTLLFVDSWRMKEKCQRTAEIQDHCKHRKSIRSWATKRCSILKQDPFAVCHADVEPDEYLQQCQKDTCACVSSGDYGCYCPVLAAYADACTIHGIAIPWRSKKRCPLRCDDENSYYSPCITSCPPETCENTREYKQIEISCITEPCVEGCQRKNVCKEDYVYSDSSLKKCVPRTSCKG